MLLAADIREERERVAPKIKDIDDPRVALAVVGHPYRVEIMAMLERGSASPSDVARAIGVPTEKLAYHFRVLSNAGVIELEERLQVRGAVKHRYRMVQKPRISEEAWAKLPAVAKEVMVANSLDHTMRVTMAAVVSGGMDKPECLVSRRALRVDRQGYREVFEILEAALAEVKAVEARAAVRLDAHETDEEPATVVALLFDTPDPAAVLQLAGDGAGRKRRRKRAPTVT